MKTRFASALVLLLLGIAGCASPKETEGDQPARRTARAAEGPPAVDPQLQTSLDVVQSIQLYAGEEDQLPVLSLHDDHALTLEFDLMETAGRPLSAFFYHANRSWRRDLFANEYLTSFHRDDLFNYQPSRNTQVDYVHYTYTFPNESIDFRLSGNYIIRITEQGDEEAVLFERAFFVTEEAGPAQLGTESVMVAGQGMAATVPVLSFSPPSGLQGNVFDYTVCFIRNGRFESTRCSDRPSLSQSPDLLFFLRPEWAFEPQPGDYYLNLNSLRVGGPVERLDMTTSPFQITLEPDYARFPASGIDPLLNGQSVISDAVRDVGDPDVEAEYVEVGFSFVPDGEQPLPGDLYITGSFNGWSFDLANEMQWFAERKRYEGSLLIKLGQYEYRYTSPDARVRQALRHTLPRPENHYAAFVYYSDTILNTDRLLAARFALAR